MKYNKDRQPEAWPQDFLEAIRQAPKDWVIARGDYIAMRSDQKKWSLFLRAIRERPLHPFHKKLEELRPRTHILGNVLVVYWKEQTSERGINAVCRDAILRALGEPV